jgi:O-antigen ligase
MPMFDPKPLVRVPRPRRPMDGRQPSFTPAGDLALIRPSGSRQASFLLQTFVVTVFLLPSDTVIRVIGAQGYVASLVSMAIFFGWILTAIFGFHDPLHTRYPVRGALGLLWFSSLLSYAAMPFFGPTDAQRLSAERWLMLLAGMSGIILVAAEHLRAPHDIMRVIRVLVWGAAFSGATAVVQFFLGWDVKPILRMALPGFDTNFAISGFQAREALTRVSGTSTNPIELGVIAAMILPLAIWLGFFDSARSKLRRWAPVALIAMCVPMSVSRSAILGVGISLGVFLVLLPARQRAWMLAFVPVGLVFVFATTPGYIRTIANSFGLGTADPSITNRLDNYPRVLAAFRDAPWLGRGGGTDLPPDATKILDNQYLKSAIELGSLGVLALCLYFFIPAIAALAARAQATETPFRALCAALAGACLAAALGSYTFDSFSFAQFASVHALMIGLCGTCWSHVRRWPRPTAVDSAPAPLAREASL